MKDNIILAHFDFDGCSVRIEYILFVISGLTKYAILHLHKTVGGKILGSYLYPAGGSLSMLQSMRSLTVAPPPPPEVTSTLIFEQEWTSTEEYLYINLVEVQSD